MRCEAAKVLGAMVQGQKGTRVQGYKGTRVQGCYRCLVGEYTKVRQKLRKPKTVLVSISAS